MTGKIYNKLYNEARHGYDNHLDESPLTKAVNNILESANICHDSPMLHVHGIQTQSIDPTSSQNTLLNPLQKKKEKKNRKKWDLALVFSSDHYAVATANRTQIWLLTR